MQKNTFPSRQSCPRSQVRVAFGLLAFLTFPTGATADIAFSNLYPGDMFEWWQGYNISGPDVGEPLWQKTTQGMQFTAQSSGQVTTIKAAMLLSAGLNEFTIGLYSDDNNAVGSNLGSVTVANQMASWGTSGPATQINFLPLGISVLSGSKYWLIAEARADTYATWNVVLAPGPWCYSRNNEPWLYGNANQGGFSVATQPVPELDPLLGLATAFVLLASRVSKRNASSSLATDPN